MVNRNMLKGKIAEAGLTQTELAARIGIGYNTLSYKLNGKKSFTVEEADKICNALGIRDNETKALIFLG